MTAQQEFDDTYISSSEISRELGISRSTIVQGKKRGMLPDPVTVNGAQIQLWKRVEVRPYLDTWKAALQQRRGAPVT